MLLGYYVLLAIISWEASVLCHPIAPAVFLGVYLPGVLFANLQKMGQHLGAELALVMYHLPTWIYWTILLSHPAGVRDACGCLSLRCALRPLLALAMLEAFYS